MNPPSAGHRTGVPIRFGATESGAPSDRWRGSILPRLFSGVAAGIGLLILVGWALDVPELRAVGPATNAAGNPTTALCFVGVAATIWILAVASHNPERRVYLARGLALILVAVGALRLLGMLAGHAEGIDSILFHDAIGNTADGRSNRMATAAAVNFMLLGAALVLSSYRVEAREALAQVLELVVLSLSLVSLLAHVYRSGWFDSVGQFNRMAVPTGVAFTLLSLGALTLRRHSGILAVVLSDGPGGRMARGLLPASFLAPAICGWIALWGLRVTTRVGQPDLVVMLLVLAVIVVFVGLVAWNATQVHHWHLERARADAALRDSESRFRLLAENGSDVVSLHDPSGRVVYVSPSCERVLGFTADELTRMSPFALVHPEDGDRLRRHFDDLLRGAPVTAISCRMLHKTGKHLWLEMMWRAVSDPEGRVVRLQASSRDVTDRRDYERQLEDARRKLQVNQESLIEANTRLAALASQDGLTGLKNRRAFEERMLEELARIRRTGQPVSLLLLDIDHFKAFNDTFGHPRGDEVLRNVARHLSRCIRDTDVAVRYGGEEFAVILPNTGADGAAQMGERLRGAIAEAVWSERAITVSVGAATAVQASTLIEHLIDQADRALYRSKQDGRNRVTLADAA